MPEYSDVYVISRRRDSASVQKFLEHFLPQREESADDYEVPQYADEPQTTYERASEVMDHCAANVDEGYGLYWHAIGKSKTEHAMVLYLQDGHVIYGLSTDAADEPYVRQLLTSMKAFLDSCCGYIAHEASPDAATLEEFEALTKTAGTLNKGE